MLSGVVVVMVMKVGGGEEQRWRGKNVYIIGEKEACSMENFFSLSLSHPQPPKLSFASFLLPFHHYYSSFFLAWC